MPTIRYYCPKHTNELLFSEFVLPVEANDSASHFQIPEKPEKCPICGSFYYKAECKKEEHHD